jgi:hypothetical protein
MSEYTPDLWVVLKVTPKNDKPWYRVMGSWYGGFAGSDSWRMNSGITDCYKEVGGEIFYFVGSSGSTYRCHEKCYGTSSYSQSILNHAIKEYSHAGSTLELMPENTNWLEMNYAG